MQTARSPRRRCPSQGSPANAVSLSLGPNLFLDDYLIIESKGLKRTTHQPKKLADPVIREGMALFYVKILYDSDLGCYRMWYNNFKPTLGYSYAESDDGIKWRLPKLGLAKVAGARNYIDAPKGQWSLFMVDEGSDFADPSRRYKMAYFRVKEGMKVAFSADGMHFKPYKGNPVLREYVPDIPKDSPGSCLTSDVIEGCWDPIKKEYLVACKIWQNGFPGKPAYADEGCRRVVGITTSKDFIKWEKSRVVVLPDPKNGLEEFYAFKPMVRGNLYIGFLRVLRDDLGATPGGPVQGIGWTELLTSRDGRNWTRYQDKFLDRDPREGQWDHAMAWYGDCITVGDKEYVYYGGYRGGHKVRDNPGDRSLGMAFLRKNGFVSRDAGDDGGSLKTPPAVLPGSNLTVNANVRKEMKVRLIDQQGNAIDGFDWADCKTVSGDSLSHRVEWQGNPALPMDRPVSLEFSLRNAEFYGFDLAK